MVIGLIIGLLSIRLGDLHVALVTLTFGLLVENLGFTLPQFVNSGLGLTLTRPSFATSDRAYAYVCLAAFIIVALFILNFRRSTTGLAMNAVRWSDLGARTTGVSVVQMKVTVAALVAGIGGGLLAVAQTSIVPNEFDTFLGVVWLALLVTIGIRCGAGGGDLLRHAARARPGVPAGLDGQRPGSPLGPRRHFRSEVPEGTLAEQGRMFRGWLLRLADSQTPPVFVDGFSHDGAVVNGDVGSGAGAEQAPVMVEHVP
jgi:branched-chain amino acid transport system permease protein